LVAGSSLVLWLYSGILIVLQAYALHKLVLLLHSRRRPRPKEFVEEQVPGAELPGVTVQLPIYDEATVVERLLRAVGRLDWPRDRLEIQVLDDSTDETSVIADREVARLVAEGLDARVLRRPTRVGFKAGALAHGLVHARHDLLCVFDADFLPPPDFLRRATPPFKDPRLGMVQARWGHANRDESALTRAQATLLDGHFVIEHAARSNMGVFFNFNGTAGIWRRATIEAAGGWQHDTLTEDLDLSYRAQLVGWRFLYLPDLVAPAEVPADLHAFLAQQRRWTKGSVQVLKKLGGSIARSRAPWRTRLEAFAHLTSNGGYPLVFLLSLLLPLIVARPNGGSAPTHALAFGLCTLSVVLFYERSQRAVGRSLGARLADTLRAIALGVGMSLSQTRAVLEGISPRVGVFERTPKRGDSGGRRYATLARSWPGVELWMAAWFVLGILAAVRAGNFGALPFLLLFLGGFGWVGLLSLREGWGGPAPPQFPCTPCVK
jgi:hypothetical protein